MTTPSSEVKSRNSAFAQKACTNICHEYPDPTNPYAIEKVEWHGYDSLELAKHSSFVDVLFLMFRGELPTKDQAQLLETLMIGLMNPGPRHPAVRAAMTAGVSKTMAQNILPLSLSIMGGEHRGASEVDKAMRFIKAQIVTMTFKPEKGDLTVAPGFGTHYGSIDRQAQQLLDLLLSRPAAGTHLKWTKQFVKSIETDGIGVTSTSVAAATLLDLGFLPKEGIGIFQLLSAPGLYAHGVEQIGKSILAMPFIGDENYFIEDT